MFRRGVVVCVAALVLLLSGCGSDKVTVTTPSAKSSSSQSSSTESSEESSTADAPSAPLDADACVEVTGANLDLATATNGADAQTAADTLKKYDPPASVGEAVDHFVETEGAQIDDPDFQEFNDAIDKWVKQVCP